MEFFDIRKMPVSLWRNGAGETREICCFPPATRDFFWRASIATIASNGEFSSFPGVDRVITLLEGGSDAGCRSGVLPYPEAPSALLFFRRPAGKSAAERRADVDGLQHHDPAGLLPGESAGGGPHLHYLWLTRGVVFVLSGAWQLGDKLLTADQGASWEEGTHTLRLLESHGRLLFSEINWLPGH